MSSSYFHAGFCKQVYQQHVDNGIMFDWLRYRYKLWRFHAEKRLTHRRMEKTHRRAERGGNIQTALENMKSRKWRNDMSIDNDIYQLESDYVQRQAERLLL